MKKQLNKVTQRNQRSFFVIVALCLSIIILMSMVLVSCRKPLNTDTARMRFNVEVNKMINTLDENGTLNEPSGSEFANELKDLPHNDWELLTQAYNDLIEEEGFLQLNANIQSIKEFLALLIDEYLSYDNNEKMSQQPKDVAPPIQEAPLYLTYNWIINLGSGFNITNWNDVKTDVITKMTLALEQSLCFLAEISIAQPLFISWLIGNSIYLAKQMISAVNLKQGVSLSIGWWLFSPQINADTN